MEWFSNWVAEALGLSVDLVRKLVGTIAVLGGYFLLRRLVVRIAGARFEEPLTRFRVSRAARIFLMLTGIVILVRIWFRGAEGIATWLGLMTAAIAVSLQDPLENLAGWLYLVTSRPFQIGDRIQISDHAGDVVDIRPMSFALLEIGNWVNADQSTGRVIQIPNGWVFKHSIAGYDHGFAFIWNEIAVTVTFESDWRRAKLALETILAEKAERIDDEEFSRPSEFLGIQYTRLTPVVWTDTAPEGVRLTMRYLCRPRNRRVSSSTIWEAVLDAFAKLENVDFAYPTTRRFDHAVEGKVVLREGAVKVARRPASADPDPV
jgi:small-conductance mechanosensitive channel